MHPKYPNTFKPIQLGPIEIPNRFYVSPHVCPYTDARGGPTEDFVHYFLERVKGGCGLVILSTAVPERARYVVPSAHAKETIPAFRKFADAMHDAGAKVFGELWYWWGTPGFWDTFGTATPGLSPSVVQFNHFGKGAATREITKAEIRAMIDAFRQTSAHFREANFDGIMLHASHGAIPEQFLSPHFNRRTDEYGGSLENRMRFLNETLAAIREACGDEMAVGIRLNCDELLPTGYDTQGASEILERVAKSGLIDFVDLDVAIEPDQLHLGMPPVFVEKHVYAPYVKAVRDAAGKVPVLSVLGRLTSIADGEKALASGLCDMVGAARALIAEPHLVKHAYEGNEERSRTCTACNWCMAALLDGSQTCTVNPSAWKERIWGEDSYTPAARRSKVVVVGAGPGGLEAARVSALRGHEVVLFEARAEVGGALAKWAELPGREFFASNIAWYERELARLGVRTHLGTAATASVILEQKPDAVILATGARYSASGHSNHRDADIPGHDDEFVYSADDILFKRIRPSGKVLVLDGEGMHTGVGIAEALALSGAQVELLTPHISPVSPRVTAALETPLLMKRLHAAGVKLSTSSYIGRIDARRVSVYDVHSERQRVIEDVDAVVLATGRVSVNDLEKDLEGKVAQLFVIGDAAAARLWPMASYEGHKFARYIGEPNAPRSIAEVYFGINDP